MNQPNNKGKFQYRNQVQVKMKLNRFRNLLKVKKVKLFQISQVIHLNLQIY